MAMAPPAAFALLMRLPKLFCSSSTTSSVSAKISATCGPCCMSTVNGDCPASKLFAKSPRFLRSDIDCCCICHDAPAAPFTAPAASSAAGLSAAIAA